MLQNGRKKDTVKTLSVAEADLTPNKITTIRAAYKRK